MSSNLTNGLYVCGHEQNSHSAYSSQLPFIIHDSLPITKLIICSEHPWLVHVCSILLSCLLNHHLYLSGCKVIRSITHACVICHCVAARPQSEKVRQLSLELVTPDLVLSSVWIDCAWPLWLKLGSTRQPLSIKTYVCMFVMLYVKAVCLELMSDLTMDAFVAYLWRFISRRGKPTPLLSDHGMNFTGASPGNQRSEQFSSNLEKRRK